jgi:hypothetical protein
MDCDKNSIKGIKLFFWSLYSLSHFINIK